MLDIDRVSIMCNLFCRIHFGPTRCQLHQSRRPHCLRIFNFDARLAKVKRGLLKLLSSLPMRLLHEAFF
jgi:hypothetical protein